MKGTILDFDENAKRGLLLGEDGNRYFFDYEKEWKNKNKNPETDSSVDFIIKDNEATEIFSLNKKSTNSLEIEKKLNTSTNNNQNFKKINFEEIDKEMYSDKRLEEKRATVKKFFLILLAVDIVGYFFTKTGLSIVAFIVLFFSIPFTLAILFPLYKLVIRKDIIPKDRAKEMNKNDVIDEVYANSLTILNYIPENLNHTVIKMISSSDNDYEDAKKQLIRQAYELKADAILNFKADSNTNSDVSSSFIPMTNTQQIRTKIINNTRLEGIAVKFI